MDATYIVTVYVMLDDVLKGQGQRDDSRTRISAAEIVTVAVVAAQYFQNHQERALCVLQQLHYIPRLSVSRFNRRLHALGEVVLRLASVLGEQAAQGDVFVIDTMPVPVCRRVRAARCRKVQGRAYQGQCWSKADAYVGWQLHLVCHAQRVPVAFELLPAHWDELTLVQDLLSVLPPGAAVVADKGYLSDHDQQLSWLYGQVRLIPLQRATMAGNSAADADLIRTCRRRIETLFSQLEKMGVQRLHARTTPGFAVKVLALIFTNALV